MMAMDGGTTYLRTRDAEGDQIWFHLDWSIAAQREGTAQFSVRGQAVPKGSDEEKRWLRLIAEAAEALASPSLKEEPESPGGKLVLLPPEDAAYFQAMEEGPDEALRVLALRFVDLIKSERYQNGVPLKPAPPIEETVRRLLGEGRRLEAMQAYREANPDASLAEAKAAVERIGGASEG